MKRLSYDANEEEKKLLLALRKRVRERVAAIPENRDRYLQLKAFILPVLYFGAM